MPYPIRFTEEAEKDLTNAAMWFADEVGIDLANRFIDLVESNTRKIAENPSITRLSTRTIGSVSSGPSPMS